jgi:CheY-like chemotaxis protein
VESDEITRVGLLGHAGTTTCLMGRLGRSAKTGRVRSSRGPQWHESWSSTTRRTRSRADHRPAAVEGFEVSGRAMRTRVMELLQDGAPPTSRIVDLMMPGTNGIELARKIRDRTPSCARRPDERLSPERAAAQSRGLRRHRLRARSRTSAGAGRVPAREDRSERHPERSRRAEERLAALRVVARGRTGRTPRQHQRRGLPAPG